MLTVIASLLTAIAAFPLLIMTVEILSGIRAQPPICPKTRPRATILIPAHDEAGGIGAVIAAIASSGLDILVVADNCTDATAAVTRAAGAQVIERTDPTHRGKGYALAFGRAALAEDPPEIVIIIDADCIPHGDALHRLADRAAQTGRVVQARYDLDTRADDTPMTRISNFAFAVKNIVRQRGLTRVAGTCVLTGTGMAFPWAQFRDAPLATDDSVEDLTIGLALVRAGRLPLYADDAHVSSVPATGAAAATQRTRWEHGFVATATTLAPKMLAQGRWPSFWLALHLAVPPLALTFGIAMLALIITIALGSVSSLMPALLLASVIALAGTAILAAWAAVGRGILPLPMLLRVPLYIVGKLPIYAKLARGADRRWTRTERD